jgi:aminoglycoside phosphotransferase (APT) family kinase protein
MGDAIEIVPQARREGVRAALRSAFGARPAAGLQPISGGVSGALICRFEVLDRPYLLRLEPERIPLPDRQRGFAAMAAAAAAGAAPAVHFADAASGVAIMDYVDGRPLALHPGGPAQMARALGALIARVQATAPFQSLGEYPQMIAAMLDRLGGSGVLALGLVSPHAEGLARIRSALRWDARAMVSSHNDPNPRNILFDGERLWLIDWELAFRNDPLVDVAILTLDLAETPELEDILLQAAFGRAPDRSTRARLAVIRLLTRLFYGCIVLESLAGAPRPRPGASLAAALTPAAFRAAAAEGRFPSAAETAYAFARMSLAAFVDGLAAPGFADTLEMVRQS